MKTTFTVRIIHPDAMLAKKVASTCIEQIDRIENTLSRYIAGSDVSQINQMQAGETRFLSETCYDCLRIALNAFVDTEGLFDITLGRQIEHQKNQVNGSPPPRTGQLMVDPNRPSIHCIEAGREIDLGGIGKGFALDQLKITMEGLGVSCALLSSGASTHLAFGEHAWPIQLEGCEERQSIDLKNQAISASGHTIQGAHLVSPRNKTLRYTYSRVWAVDVLAATADAWSTACMLMSKEELEAKKKERDIFTAP